MKLSIVIATHARPASLVRLIASLAPQLHAGDHELFIAENGTPAPTALDRSAFATAADIIHLHDPLPGKCRVQNRAIAAARGDLLAFLDDDLAVAQGYVDAVERFFAEYPHFAAMKGRILPAEDPVAKVGATAPYLDLPIADHGDRVVEVRGVLGANMAFRASALRQVGPFDERLGPGAAGHEEETEMSQRLRRAGLHIGYAPQALVWHEVDPARADRHRFIRIARERGYCRMLHESHSRCEILGKELTASIRLTIARVIGAPVQRLAREERRLAIARGMRDGLGKGSPGENADAGSLLPH
ncbi:MAG: glycosyltransferase [Candidatus Binataceae bacterium]